MLRTRIPWLVAVPVIAVACGGSSKTSATASSDGGPESSAGEGGPQEEGGDDSSAETSNSTSVVVNSGPPSVGGSVDVPFISVKICVPGTDTCQTIDYVSVDTGSSGLRIVSSILSNNLTLPQAMATTGDPLVECMQFDDGYTWGSVRYADVKIAGEVATKIPIQIIGDPAYGTVPSDCSSSGPGEDTVADFGSYGLIGINQIVPDCGAACADTTNVQTGAYYSCASASTCTAVAVANADQVPNPIADFTTDNNGSVLQFPTVAASGAPSLSGTLTFGIGTQSNNGLGSAAVQTTDQYGNFTTVFNGATLDESFIDSGTNLYSFDDSSIAQCPSDLSGFYCPTSTVSLSATNKGLNGTTANVSFSVENAETLFGNGTNAAFDDLAGTGVGGPSFDWGFPFFIGRTVYVALDGATTPGGKGPYFAY